MMNGSARRISAVLVWCAALTVAADQQLAFDVVVNDQPGRTLILLERDGELFINVADFPVLRIRMPEAALLESAGERWIGVLALAGVTVERDAAGQRLLLTLPPTAFSSTRVEAASSAPVAVPLVTLGAYLNYDVFAEAIDDDETLAGFADLTAFGRWGSLINTAIASRDERESTFARLDTTLINDDPVTLRSVRVGDSITVPGAWGRALRFGGVQVATNFALRPDLVTTPLLNATGSAVVPSTVDVLVNGRLVAEQDVAPGPFSVTGLPAMTGAGDVTMVVRDALGRETVISQPFYSDTQLLQRGLSEYSIELGAVRREYAEQSFSYGDALVAGTVRHGIHDRLTIGAHAEGIVDDAGAIGVEADWQIADIAILRPSLAVGRDDDDAGSFAGLGFEKIGERVTMTVLAQWYGDGFREPGDDEVFELPEKRYSASIGWRAMNTLSFVLGGVREEARESGSDLDAVSFSASLSLSNAGFLLLSATLADRGEGDESGSVFLSWTLPLGGRRSVSAQASRYDADGAADSEVRAALRQSLPRGIGYGFDLEAANDGDGLAAGYLQAEYGTVGLELARRDESDGARASASGSVAWMPPTWFVGRNIDRGFAVLEVADVPGIPVFVDNQRIGVTDARGQIVLTDLRPYERNQVSVNALALPLDVAIADDDFEITVGARSGALVPFPAARVRALSFRLARVGAAPIPPGARLDVLGGFARVGLDGRVYLPDIGDNERFEAKVQWLSGRCRAQIEVPRFAPAPIDLGVIECVE